MGTSSMPLGLTIGGSTPNPAGSQSLLDCTVSCSRTSASVRGTPTLNCTVTTASPGRRPTAHAPRRRSAPAPARPDRPPSAPHPHGGAREGDQHIGHGHVDLRLFLARGDGPTAKMPSSSATRASSGVICACLEEGARCGPTAAQTDGGCGVSACSESDMVVSLCRGQRAAGSARAAACGSVTTRSPGIRPDSTSSVPAVLRPSRTWRSRGWPAASST